MPTRSVFSSDASKENSSASGDKNAKELNKIKLIEHKWESSDKNKAKSDNDENGIPFLETILNEPSKQSNEHLDNLHAQSDVVVDSDHHREDTDQYEKEKIQFIRSRPTTAKPTDVKRRSTPTTSSEKSSSNCCEKANVRSSSTTTSLSSFSTFEGTFDENDSVNTFDRDVTENLITYRESQIREELLHRYLDLHICESYEKQKSNFDRYSRQPLARQRGPVSRRPNSAKFRKLNDEQLKLKSAKSAYLKPRRQTRLDVIGSREAGVKRTIRRLVRELRKLEAYKLFLSQRMPKTGKSSGMVGKPPRPRTAKPGKQRKDRLKQQSEGPNTDVKEEVKVMLPSTNDQPEPKSILKSPDTNGDSNIEKHVRMKNRQNSNDSYSITERYLDDTPAKHYYYQGQVFSYDYLASLLGTLQCSKSEIKGLLGPYGPLKEVSLLRDPIRSTYNNQHRRLMSAQSNKLTEYRTGIRGKEKDNNPKNKDKSHLSLRPKPANAKVCVVIKDDGKFEGNDSASPRVTPGTGPIKCNWQPEKQQTKEIKETDHQLKNTDNPAIAEWLKQKNMMARQEKHIALRRNRVKRNKLLEEYNEKEEHREQAVIEYEKWKKRKNREILLRRRKEALDANCEKNNSPARPNTAATTSADVSRTSRHTEHMLTTFSDLRSSAIINPPPLTQPSTLKQGSKPRPKSAPTKVSFNTPIATHAIKKTNLVPVKIDFESGDVTLVKNGHDNLSAREPIIGNKSTERVTNGFLREFLEVTSEKVPSMFDIPPQDTFSQPQDGDIGQKNNINNPNRNQYNEWVRTDGKSPTKSKTKRKNKSKEAKIHHDPLTNELLSDLAKRRIQKILDKKKRVDSGLNARPASAAPVKIEREPNKKWRMSEELLEEKKEKKKVAKRKSDERPKFSFDRKTNSTSLSHQRNSVI